MMGDKSPISLTIPEELTKVDGRGSPGEVGSQVPAAPDPVVVSAGLGEAPGTSFQGATPGYLGPADSHPTGGESLERTQESEENGKQVEVRLPAPFPFPKGVRFEPGTTFRGIITRSVEAANTHPTGGLTLDGGPMRLTAKRRGSLSPIKECPKRPAIGVKQLTRAATGKSSRRGRKQEVSEDEIKATAHARLDDLLSDEGRTNVHFTFKEIHRLNELIRDAGNVKHDIAQSGNVLLVLVRLADGLWRDMRERYNMLLQEAEAERVARLSLEERVSALELHESQTRMDVDGQVPLSELHALRDQNTALMQKVEELTKTLAEHVAGTPTHTEDEAHSAELLTLREENSDLRVEIAKLTKSVARLEQAQLAAKASHSEELSKLRQENATLQAKLKGQEGAKAQGNGSGRKKKKKGKQRETIPQADKQSDGNDQDPEPPGSSGGAGGEGEGQGSGNGEFVVVRRKKAPKPKTRSKGEAVVIKASETEYATILRNMRTDPKLTELGKVTRSVRRTRNNELLLVLNKGARGACEYARLVTEVVGGTGTVVKPLSSETTLQCKNLDETVTPDVLLKAIAEQCNTGKLETKVQLKKYSRCTQTATFKLPDSIAVKVLKVGKLKVNWSICPVSQVERPLACFKCFGYGHKSWACKGPDRSKLCRRCGCDGHKAKGCTAKPKCLICPEDGDGNHITGSFNCPSYKSALAALKPCK